ncbi:hypothetical protein AB1L42_23365 [Thalassoglobus sp. JC818]|uniref:hypothetical protein n=1 Tax=Thalassoglobus sp. JC818 TaxID=3232136 RepID=UPI003458E60C
MNKGELANLVEELQERRRKKREELSHELKQLNDVEKKAREGRVLYREALVCAYLGVLQRRINGPVMGFRALNGGPTFDGHGDYESFLKGLKENRKINVIDGHGRQVRQLPVSDLEETIHPRLSIDDKLREIDKAERLEEQGLVDRRSTVERELRDARYLPMKRLFALKEITEKLSQFEHGELFVYLITEGFLGEDYDYYTSYFHKGAITHVDREFVQRFNKGDEIDSGEKIDTPNEILLILDDGLFGKPQGFNITLVDHVLGVTVGVHHARLIEGLIAFPDEAFRFLEAYYAEGEHTAKLLRTLIQNWENFLEDAAGCSNPLPHVKEILSKALSNTIKELRQPSRFTQLIEKSGPDIFDRPELAERIPLLAKSGMLISDISFSGLSNECRMAAIDAVTDHAIWELTPKNVSTILAKHGVEAKVAKSEMFLSLKNAPPSVFRHVEKHINNFFENCYLKVDETVTEPQEGVEMLLSVQGLKEDLGKRVVERQEARLRFLEVPKCYWATVVEEEKFVINWENVEDLFDETGDFEQLAPIFRSPDVVSELAKDGKKNQPKLFDQLVEFDEMDLESYKKLIRPDLGKVAHYPTTIDNKKKLHLIRFGTIELSQDTYSWLGSDPELRVALIEKQFSTFQEKIEDWPLGEKELAGLLKSSIPLDAKRKLLLNAGTINCGEDEKLTNEVVQILANPGTAIDDSDQNFVEKVIKAVPKGDAVNLLTLMIPKWDQARVMSNLEAIGAPYEEIAKYGKRPLIAESEINLALVKCLKEADFISKFKRDEKGIRIITKRKDHSE